MPDILPGNTDIWLDLEEIIYSVFKRFGLSQIRVPIVEMTSLFARSIGGVTDIVEKEMYTFHDRSGDSLSLRPELTAGVVRAAIENNLLYNQTQRLWASGPIFRYERPQKGRYRQFYQAGVELFGFRDPMADVEVIEIASALWAELGLSDSLTLNLNTIGSSQSRKKYEEKLVEYLAERRDDLDLDSQRRLNSNPLRILDSKNEQTQLILNDMPVLTEFLTEADLDHFYQITKELENIGIDYEFNNRLVRGLDYYTRTVFEWTTDLIGSQSTVCGGGRYDGLVELLGGKPTPAVGFAIGLERLFLLTGSLKESVRPAVDIFLIAVEKRFRSHVRCLAQDIRKNFSHLAVMVNLGEGSLKSQLKKADRSGALVGLIIGENEFLNNSVTIKPLRNGDQKFSPQEHIIEELRSFFPEF